MGKKFLFYVGIHDLDNIERDLDEFREIIRKQQFFDKTDKILYIPSFETRLEEMYDWDTEVEINDPGPEVH